MNREIFLSELSQLLAKHEMKNTLIVYVGGGKIFNTTIHLEQNDTGKALDKLSDGIDSFLRGE
jgi:hypothetical protein